MEWREYKLSQVATLTTGYPFDGHKYDKEGIRVVRGDNVTIGKLRWDSDKDKRWNEPFDRASEYSLSAEDIVIGMDGSRVGKNRAQVKQEDLPLYIAQRVACVRNNSLSEQAFLYYQIFSDRFENYIKSVHTGTSIPHVSLKQIGDFPILLPPIEVQKKISSILKSLDDKIENNRKINENLEQQAQALFKSWFVDFEPFRDQPFVESELGMIPEGWRVGTLSEIADINPIRTLTKGQNAMYLDMKNMPTTGSFPIRWEKKDYSGGMKFKNQDTIMARITPCLENGKVAYINFLDDNEIAFGSTEYIVMTTKDGFMPELLYFLCRDKAFKDYATVNMNGSSGRQRVSGDVIGNYKIVIPPKKILKPLSNYYKNVMDINRNNGFENLRLSHLRDTLLPKLMSGEIKL